MVDINKSDFGFKPDPENNQILFGLKGLLNVGDDVIVSIIKNRPYVSPKDFLNKVNPNKQAMVSLIKSGAFDEMFERKFTMAWYLWETCDKKKKITLQNMSSLIKYNLIQSNDEKVKMALRVFEFNRYLKAVCNQKKTDKYELDTRAVNFLIELNKENIIDSNYMCPIKLWDNEYQLYMNVLRKYIVENHDKILEELNIKIFKDEWDKYAKGNLSSWEMEVMCFYYHEHELEHIKKDKYNLTDFFKLSQYPVVDEANCSNFRGRKITRYKLSKIYGTCIAKDKVRSTVSLLTPTGVVNVKFGKEYFAMFDKQISVRQPDGTKKVVEKSWFGRGNMIMVQGMRSEDTFIAKKYYSSNSHQLYRILDIDKEGNITLQSERYQGDIEDDEM